MLRHSGNLWIDARSLWLIRAENSVGTDHNDSWAPDHLESSVWPQQDDFVGGMPVWVISHSDFPQEFPGAIEGLGDINGARSCFTDDNGITPVRKLKSGDIVTFAIFTRRPEHPLIDIRTRELITHGVNGLGLKPAVVTGGLVPATSKEMILAI